MTSKTPKLSILILGLGLTLLSATAAALKVVIADLSAGLESCSPSF